MIYLDNNATTRVADEVLEAMQPYYRQFYGNPHSAHALGRAAHDGVEGARDEVAALLGATADEIFFTSCGTESNAMVIRGLARDARRGVVTTAVEHPSVLALFRELEAEGAITLTVAGVKADGSLDLDELDRAITDATLLVSVMLAQNEIGTIYPVAQIAEIAHARGALVFTDAVQAAGKIALDAKQLGVDLLSISGHKFHAPKGAGALFVRRGLSLHPLWRGGNQERGLRSGTEGVPQIVGLGEAARIARERLSEMTRVAGLRDAFESEVLAKTDAVVNGGEVRLPNTASISFRGRRSDELVNALDRAGVFVSAGAACHSGRVEASGVMKAIGRELDLALGTVRFSLSRYTTHEEIAEAVAVVAGVVQNDSQ